MSDPTMTSGAARRIQELEAALAEQEAEVLERAIDRMGWPEINAFFGELKHGQAIDEDGGGYFMRAIRRLFGLPPRERTVENYRQAARRMVEEAERQRKDQTAGQARGKMVKVRIAVVVDRDGKWAAYGFSRANGRPADEEAWEAVLDIVEDGEARYRVTAELPVPEDTEVVGAVEQADA